MVGNVCERNWTRVDWLILSGLFILALAFRIAIFGQAFHVDAATWIWDAQELLRGGILYRTIGTDKPPLIVLLTAASLWVSGGSTLFLRWVVAIMTASMAPALFLIGRRLLGRPAGFAAAFLFAVDVLSTWWGHLNL